MCFEYVEFVKSSNWENTDSHFRVIAANDLAYEFLPRNLADR